MENEKRYVSHQAVLGCASTLVAASHRDDPPSEDLRNLWREVAVEARQVCDVMVSHIKELEDEVCFQTQEVDKLRRAYEGAVEKIDGHYQKCVRLEDRVAALEKDRVALLAEIARLREPKAVMDAAEALLRSVGVRSCEVYDRSTGVKLERYLGDGWVYVRGFDFRDAYEKARESWGGK